METKPWGRELTDIFYGSYSVPQLKIELLSFDNKYIPLVRREHTHRNKVQLICKHCGKPMEAFCKGRKKCFKCRQKYDRDRQRRPVDNSVDNMCVVAKLKE